MNQIGASSPEQVPGNIFKLIHLFFVFTSRGNEKLWAVFQQIFFKFKSVPQELEFRQEPQKCFDTYIDLFLK